MRKEPTNRPTLSQHSKDSNSYRIISTVRQLFISGQKVTDKQINDITRSNDARKVISTLRSQGMNIQDIRMPDNCKLYWLVEDDRQIPLFRKDGDND